MKIYIIYMILTLSNGDYVELTGGEYFKTLPTCYETLDKFIPDIISEFHPTLIVSQCLEKSIEPLS